MSIPNVGTYLSSDVLLMMPHAIDSKPLVRTMRGTESLVVTGSRILETAAEFPGAIREYQFVCESRADTRALEDFFDSKLGAHDGFWMPTWQWEFEIQNHDEDGPDLDHQWIWIRASDYLPVYNLGHAFRHIALFYGDNWNPSEVAEVVDNNPGGTDFERLSITSAGTSFLPARPWVEQTGVRPTWLRYVRFADDVIETQELGDDSSLITTHVQELPNETPGT